MRGIGRWGVLSVVGVRWAAAIVLLLCGWGAAKADCIVEKDHTIAAAYAQCEAAEKIALVPPRTWYNNQCAPVPDAPSSISCTSATW